MTVTYLGTLATDLDKLRFWIQDTTEGAGPKPDKANFSDDELNGLISAEGNWRQAVAAAFEVLESAWSGYADWQAGPRRESASQIADRYHQQAEKWRAQAGSGYAVLTRTDAYTSDNSEYSS